jgi:hypothetical protein
LILDVIQKVFVEEEISQGDRKGSSSAHWRTLGPRLLYSNGGNR